MRDFNLDDLYNAWDVLDAAGIDENAFEGMLKIAAENKCDVKAVGIKAIAKMLRSLAERGAQKPMYVFLSGPFETTPEEMGKKSLKEIADGIKWLFDKGYAQNFIQQLSD